jgi:predicted AAA+ superfamily ATPase
MVYIEREIEKKFVKLKDVYPVLTLVGARQAGKTTFLKEHSKKIKAAYLLFDDPDIRNMFEEDIKKFEKQFIEGYDVAILDEVQYCKNSGRNIKYLADTGKKLWLTSSSEAILNKEVLSFLVGRTSILKLYPFSLNEFLKSKNQKELNSVILRRIIHEHGVYGGYPKVIFIEDIELKKTILKDLYETMVLKDVSKVFSIDNIDSLESLIKVLALNIGNVFSYNDVSRDLNLSFESIKKYLNALEKSYLIKKINPFHKNKIKEIIKQPKIYFIDTGLRNLIAKDFPLDITGNIFENYILSELLKKGYNPSYWRTKTQLEIDFIIEKEKEIIPIEVKIKDPERIDRNIISFIEDYKPKRAFIICLNIEKKRKNKVNGCEVIFCNLSEFEQEI